MRLARGSGLSGLRRRAGAVGRSAEGVWLVRPLLGWRRDELAAIVAEAGIEAGRRPGQRRSAPRPHAGRARWLRATDWLDPERLAAAPHISPRPTRRSTGRSTPLAVSADRAATEIALTVDPVRTSARTAAAAAARRASPSWASAPPRGPDLARAIDALEARATRHTWPASSSTAAPSWRISPGAPPRRGLTGLIPLLLERQCSLF